MIGHKALSRIKFMDWYDRIEPGVREEVQALRNNGINTVSSCEHEWYIQCDCWNPTEQLRTVFDVLTELGHREFRVELYREFYKTGSTGLVMTIHFPPLSTEIPN